MIATTEAQELRERWRMKFGDDGAFERSWRKYWETATVPDVTRLEAWLQHDYDRLQFTAASIGEPGRPIFRNAIGRPLEYVHAELQICPLCGEHFEGAYLEHTGEQHRVRAQATPGVNNLRFEHKTRSQRYLEACMAAGMS